MELWDDLCSLKGVGEKTAALFHKMNIFTLQNLAEHYPTGYDVFQKPLQISEAPYGEICAVRVCVFRPFTGKKIKNLTVQTGKVNDITGIISVTFFNMPFVKNLLKPGKFYIFRGILQKKGETLRMEQPSIYKEEDYEKLLHALQPRYPLTAGISHKIIAKAVHQILSFHLWENDYMPDYILKKYYLCALGVAMEKVHFPESMKDMQEARKRIVFDEFFLFMMMLRKCREHNQKTVNQYKMFEVADTKRLLERLPYSLTAAQKRVWEEIKEDLQGETAMNRLVQGDVGSGKTIVAILALLMNAANGYQGALMAPTEVLARQHYEGIKEMAETYGLPLKPVLLTGSITARQRKDTYEKIERGEANLMIGTNALIQEKVIYKNLALVITDEQHRFGVRQREALAGKGDEVHVLVMSATPIPRTLAIILYGDLHVSLIDELPSDRLPIKNCVVNTGYRESAYKFMKDEIGKGRQVYVICPMVEEGETDGLENVIDYTAKLKSCMPAEIQISYLHGRMRPVEKNRIMESFGNGDIDILVSTTVIEVGINVPNATVIMVENAERFGLAQLHQLRGRVGRGKEQSYCIFVSSTDKKETMKRLEILNKSNDGFFVAEEDLKLRGPGDLFGIRQSGILDFKMGDIYQDADILKSASEVVEDVLEKDPGLLLPEHQLLNNHLNSRNRKQVDFRSI